MKPSIFKLTLWFLLSLTLPCRAADDGEKQRKAFVEMKAKAEKGEVEAQFTLGYMYREGLGVEKDYGEDVKSLASHRS